MLYVFINFFNERKMSSYWSSFLCIDCETLDNTQMCHADDDVRRVSWSCDMWRATNMCQRVARAEYDRVPSLCQWWQCLGRWKCQFPLDNIAPCVRPPEASNMCPGVRDSSLPVSSCQKHLILGKQWTPQHHASLPFTRHLYLFAFKWVWKIFPSLLWSFSCCRKHGMS